MSKATKQRDFLNHDAETIIFDLRRRADVFLQVGDTETRDRILATTSNLQELYGIRTRTHPATHKRAT